MYVVVHHWFKNTQVALSRGVKLMTNEGAPSGVRVLQFYPHKDGSGATCLWETPAVAPVQKYVDSVLGDSSDNKCLEIDGVQAFSQQPPGMRESAAIPA
jgi:hypothetical protein